MGEGGGVRRSKLNLPTHLKAFTYLCAAPVPKAELGSVRILWQYQQRSGAPMLCCEWVSGSAVVTEGLKLFLPADREAHPVSSVL